MNRKARETIQQFAMLEQGDTVTAAVSGGADSVALLDFLCGLIDCKLTVRACHVNHCLRGEESDRDEQLVRTMCEQYGVPLDVRRVEVKPVAQERGISIEQAAREVRYAFFSELSERYNSKIATAHTLSDTAETVLFHLARGTGMTGLCGIPPVRENIIRPLIGCSRAEIEGYCSLHGLCYVTDSTNLLDEYTRNHIRHKLLPQLDRINTDALGAIGRMTDTLRRDNDYLAREATRIHESLTNEDGLDAGRLAVQHSAIRSRIIAQLLERGGVERSAERIALIEQMLCGGRRHTLQVGRGNYIVVKNGILRLEHRSAKVSQPIRQILCRKDALNGTAVALGYGKNIEFTVCSCADYEIFKNNSKMVLKNAVDYDKIKLDIFLRPREAGDRIRPVGRGCSKLLKKLYCELGLAQRERLCVIADSDGVIFAEAVGADERVMVDSGTKRILQICITDQNTEDSDG